MNSIPKIRQTHLPLIIFKISFSLRHTTTVSCYSYINFYHDFSLTLLNFQTRSRIIQGSFRPEQQHKQSTRNRKLNNDILQQDHISILLIIKVTLQAINHLYTSIVSTYLYLCIIKQNFHIF